MNDKTITIDKESFKSKLTPIAAVLFALAAIISIIAIIKFFDPQSLIAIKTGLIKDQIKDPSAIKTWTFIYMLFTVINCLGSFALSIGLFLNSIKKTYLGMTFLSHCSKVFYYVLTASGIIAAIYFVIKLIKYIVFAWTIQQDYYGIFAAIIMEALMFTLVCFLFLKLRQFLNLCIITTTSINYTLCLSRLDAPSIPPFSVTGFLYLGIVDFIIALDRLFTFSYANVNNNVEYYLEFTPVTLQRLTSLPFIFAGIGSILIFVYLRSYKKKAERLLNVTIKDVLK